MLALQSRLAALTLLATISACVTPKSPPPIAAKPVQLADGRTIVPGEQAGLDGRSIELALVQIDVPRGKEIGRVSGEIGTMCTGMGVMGPIHQQQPRSQGRSSEWSDTFYRVMSGHGFRVTGDPSQLFDAQRDDGGELQFGLSITEMDMDIRALCDFTGRYMVGIRGKSRITVEWQVFDPVRRQVILRQRNEGRFETAEAIAPDQKVMMQLAFADAANQLATSPELRQTMTERAPLPQPGAPAVVQDRSRISLRRVALSQQPISNHIDRLRSATVLIETGTGSHGSGFLITEEGLMVTNKHVVGGQRFVRVRLVSGRAVVGEVLRAHDLRDVALVKLEGSGYPVMAIRETPVAVTEEVYVIGAPQMKQLAWTVTRGVVSAWRPAHPPSRPFDLIQSDVAIHGGNSGGPMLDRQGNLVAIAVMGWAPDPNNPSANTSLNGFIPILDGLEKLGLELVDPAEYQRRRNLTAGQ
ncbi:MAG: serine protease [Ferrovibrio sp.]|uniref:S1C family serine protease n=1 Tax=Ferrovibrio sp. TaxID=1917215 RepID=UPI00260178BC|nr:serine protease [Ferrovibrio sp.]MCW0232392.1 serine protease [Ferrovibrio sp.]